MSRECYLSNENLSDDDKTAILLTGIILSKVLRNNNIKFVKRYTHVNKKNVQIKFNGMNFQNSKDAVKLIEGKTFDKVFKNKCTIKNIETIKIWRNKSIIVDITFLLDDFN